MHSDLDIILLLSGSAILLTYMLTFVKPEPDDEEGKKDDKGKDYKNLNFDPYAPFHFKKHIYYIQSPLLLSTSSYFDNFNV